MCSHALCANTFPRRPKACLRTCGIFTATVLHLPLRTSPKQRQVVSSASSCCFRPLRRMKTCLSRMMFHLVRRRISQKPLRLRRKSKRLPKVRTTVPGTRRLRCSTHWSSTLGRLPLAPTTRRAAAGQQAPTFLTVRFSNGKRRRTGSRNTSRTRSRRGSRSSGRESLSITRAIRI